jgi:predicted acyltransferase
MADSPAPSAVPAESKRLLSLDALRGFDMMWIMGAASFVLALNQMGEIAPVKAVANQLEHVDWAGFRFYDLIFPLFVFIMGVSSVFSLSKELESGGVMAAVKRMSRRFVFLFLIALFYSGGVSTLWPNIRLLGVLNRIALVYLAVSLLFLFLKPRGLVVACASLLIGYWALMTFVPFRDIRLDPAHLSAMAESAGDPALAAKIRSDVNPSAVKDSPVWAFAEKQFAATTTQVSGKFEPGYNLANHIDFQYLPGKKWDNYYDPEGILSTIPAIATGLLGVFAGLILRSTAIDQEKKVLRLIVGGVIALALGWLWHIQFPVIKKIWTSSFVLVAGGCSALLLAAFYWMIDVKQWRGWCMPFVWYGSNAITIYLVSNMLGGFGKLSSRLVGGDVKKFFDASVTKGFGDLMIAIVALGLSFWFLRFLYNRKIFLRL